MAGKSQIKDKEHQGRQRMGSPSSALGDVTQELLLGSHFQTEEGEVDLEELRWMYPGVTVPFQP